MQYNLNMAQSRSKLIEHVVKGSFHQGDASVFSLNSVGGQCVPNCVIAGLYHNIVPMSRWTSESLDNILQHGDKLYNSIKKTTDLLQVNDVGPQITAFENPYNFCIGHEFFGRIRKHQSDNHVGSTLENSTFSVIHGEKRELILCILCVENEKSSSASLLFISNEHCYVFDPHSRNSYGLPVDSGTSILASFKSRKNMILRIHLMNSLTHCSEESPTDLYSMCIVSFDVVNIQMQSCFDDQKYQFLKSQPLAKDFEKQKRTCDERCKNGNEKCFHKRGTAKNNKVEQWKKYTEKRKNDNEICCTSKRKTYDVAQSCQSSQIEKS